jgi:oligopeptide transport system substrate-binding protein
VSLAAAQPPAATTPRPRAGGVYRRPLRNDPATLDPARISDIYGRSVAQQLFDGLVQFDQTLTVTPALAEFWKSSRDGLVWTFTLRRGVRFHHGREVTADDVVYSFTRLLDPRINSGAADSFTVIAGAREFREGRARTVSGLVALDPHTVQITLAEPTAAFVSLLAVGQAKIVPRDVVEREGEAFGRAPVGTGPFRFVRWERGKEIDLVANRDYYDGPPSLARVVFRVFAGAHYDAVHEEFARGRLEDAPVPTGERAPGADARWVYVKRPMFSVAFYGFNTRVKPLDDVRVRQALVHAIDRRAIIERVFHDHYLLARGILPPGTLGFNPQVNAPAYDPERARALLAAAGYPGGRGLPVIHVWSSARNEVTLERHALMKRNLEAVGVTAEFHYTPDWPTFTRGLAEGRFPVFLYAWFADVPDPDNFLNRLFFSRSPNNFTGYANPAVDDLLVRGRRERELPRRVELYRRAEQLVLDDAPIIPVWHYTYEWRFQRYVHSIEVNGLGDPYMSLRKIWLDPIPAGTR